MPGVEPVIHAPVVDSEPLGERNCDSLRKPINELVDNRGAGTLLPGNIAYRRLRPAALGSPGEKLQRCGLTGTDVMRTVALV